MDDHSLHDVAFKNTINLSQFVLILYILSYIQYVRNEGGILQTEHDYIHPLNTRCGREAHVAIFGAECFCKALCVLCHLSQNHSLIAIAVMIDEVLV